MVVYAADIKSRQQILVKNISRIRVNNKCTDQTVLMCRLISSIGGHINGKMCVNFHFIKGHAHIFILFGPLSWVALFS